MSMVYKVIYIVPLHNIMHQSQFARTDLVYYVMDWLFLILSE